jgi:hypothetical protein
MGKTSDNNVEILNETIDYYRYFDASQAEIFFDCVDYTINRIIPQEVEYLQKYDAMKAWLDDSYEMYNESIRNRNYSVERNFHGNSLKT